MYSCGTYLLVLTPSLRWQTVEDREIGLNYNKECEKRLIEAVKAGYSVGVKRRTLGKVK